jgi:hypothetical protein
MDEREHGWPGIDEQAAKAGIDMPVTVDPALIGKLKPSPYLSELGITLGQRIENLLSLLKANLAADSRGQASAGRKYYLPFMVLKGPLVHEDFLPVIARLGIAEGGRPSITLAEAESTE